MKVVLENGNLINFLPDNYISGNREIDNGTHPTIKIETVTECVEDEDIIKNKTRHESGVWKFKFENGVVVKKT